MSIPSNTIPTLICGKSVAVPKHSSLNTCSGIVVKTYRETHNLSCSGLATLLKMSRQGLINLEDGKYALSLKHTKTLSEIFEVPFSSILLDIAEAYTKSNL